MWSLLVARMSRHISYDPLARRVISSSPGPAAFRRGGPPSLSETVDIEESASRLIRSSSLRWRVNFNSWYSGVDASLLKSRLTQPVSRCSPIFVAGSITAAIVFFLYVENCLVERGRVFAGRMPLAQVRGSDWSPGRGRGVA